MAIAFAREGADVAFSHLPDESEDAAETRRRIEKAGRTALPVEVDLADEAGCRRLVDAVVERFRRIDILVNNAAEQREKVERFEDLDAATLERTFHVNVIAMFHLVRLALAHMAVGGVILNVASIQAYQPSPGILEEKLRKFGENAPLGRPAQPAELAPAVVFLASDESRYVDGEVLGVTGGELLA